MVNRLETLELQGLKTFATLTRLEFPGQITAIVGPNGSGKSNIADSIRWVLGEQSYSTLRAKRTEDMIFSGSQQRSRAGMASATITFNNQDGWLPIEFSEVSISRRAYRDGQNEYLLNGHKVRLRDISELLSHTGLSERTYTIIGQGLVDVALALKPDERRKLFEEAAGIGLYRSRKEESLRRLENTRKNLDRVLDILTEIKPRLRSLERQTARIEEYQRLRSDLDVVLREWYGYHWHQKQQDLRNVRNSYQDQEQRLSTLRKKYAEATTDVEDAREKLQINRKALETAHLELSQHHRKLEKATRELAIIDERQRSYEQQKRNLEIDISNLVEEITALKSQEEQYKAVIEQRLSEFDAAADEFKTVDTKLSEVSMKKESTEAELEACRKRRVGLETEKVQIAARLDEVTNRVAGLRNEETKIEDAIINLENEKEKAEERFGLLEVQFQETQKAYVLLQNKLEAKSQQIDEMQLQRGEVDQQLNGLETKHAKLQAQLDVLKQAEAALSGYSEGSKSIVADSRKGRLPTGIEPLSKHFIVEEKYERAISAALGELTDLLIVPAGGKDVVVEYLETNENDRVALVGLDLVKPQKAPGRFYGEDGFLGFAHELIQADEQYQPLVDNLFSDILIVSDRQSAKRLQPKLTGMEKAVTLQGLVIMANGVMISGYGSAGKRIGRTRRQSELQNELGDLAKEVHKLTERKTTINHSIDSLQDELESISQDLSYSEEEKSRMRLGQQEARDSLTRTSEQLTWHNERLESIRKNILEAGKVIGESESRIVDIATQIQTLIEDEKTFIIALNDMPVFELQQELNHWETHRIVTKNALDTARQRYEDHHNRIEDAERRLATFQSRLDGFDEGLKEINDNENLLRNEVSLVSQTIDAMESESIKPLTSTVEENENAVSALQKLESHSHQQVIIAERQFTQLQLELSRRKDQLDNLREKIEDDFGLVSYDYAQKIDGPTPLPFEGLIEDLPRVQELSDSVENEIKRLKGQVRRIGAINPEAQQEYYEVKERFEFLTNQTNDLEEASKDLREVIETLDGLMERDYLETFKAVDKEFSEYFSRLFNGGEAKLMFVDDADPVEGGIDIEARLPGRRRQGLALLSGGERSLTAVALIFALLKVSPTPFCILDEVDAMLDESNVGRFIELLRELSKQTQFVIITHNRNTVQAADVIYGVTMGRDSTSQMISLKLEDVDDTYLE